MTHREHNQILLNDLCIIQYLFHIFITCSHVNVTYIEVIFFLCPGTFCCLSPNREGECAAVGPGHCPDSRLVHISKTVCSSEYFKDMKTQKVAKASRHL